MPDFFKFRKRHRRGALLAGPALSHETALLKLALARAGSVRALAQALGVSENRVYRWLGGVLPNITNTLSLLSFVEDNQKNVATASRPNFQNEVNHE